jgi:hypothetical protein
MVFFFRPSISKAQEKKRRMDEQAAYANQIKKKRRKLIYTYTHRQFLGIIN